MRIKEGFVLKEVAGNNVVIGVGKTMQDFNGVVNLSESAALLFRKLTDGADKEALADALLNEYDVDRETALNDIDAFLDKLRSINLLEE